MNWNPYCRFRENGAAGFIQSYGNGTPLQYSCLENPVDWGAWQAAFYGVAKSRTRLSDFTFTFHFHALEEEMATHSSVVAWKIPGTVEPGGLPSLGSHRVRHDWSDLAAAAWSRINQRGGRERGQTRASGSGISASSWKQTGEVAEMVQREGQWLKGHKEPWGPTGERNKSRGDAADPEEADSPLPAPLPLGPRGSASGRAAAAEAGAREGALGLEPQSRQWEAESPANRCKGGRQAWGTLFRSPPLLKEEGNA